MDPNAVLGPIDPQLGGVPAASVLSVFSVKSVDRIDDQTVIMADVARKALRQIDQTATRILTARGMNPKRVREVAHALASGQWTHDYPISLEEAAALGRPVTDSLPIEIEDLMRHYPQSMLRRPSVEFIPLPYYPRPEPLPSPAEESDREAS